MYDTGYTEKYVFATIITPERKKPNKFSLELQSFPRQTQHNLWQY